MTSMPCMYSKADRLLTLDCQTACLQQTKLLLGLLHSTVAVDNIVFGILQPIIAWLAFSWLALTAGDHCTLSHLHLLLSSLLELLCFSDKLCSRCWGKEGLLHQTHLVNLVSHIRISDS